jgi:hypothetical protein
MDLTSKKGIKSKNNRISEETAIETASEENNLEPPFTI